MDRIKRFGGLWLLTLSLYSSASLAFYQDNLQRATSWLTSQQRGDGSWGLSNAEKLLFTTEAVQALRASGQRNSAYFSGITWLENHASLNADFRARRAQALGAHGDDVSDDVDRLADAQIVGVPGRDAWGLSAVYRQAPLDTAIVLNSLASLGAAVNLQAAIDTLKLSQLGGPDRGWTVALEPVSDPFTTAMVLQTLAILETTDLSLITPVGNGLATLSSRVTASAPISLVALAARAALLAGNTATAQPWLDRLAAAQSGSNGSWSARVYDTALAIRAFATADGIDNGANQTAVFMPDRNLRMAVNAALDRNAMDSLDRGELARLTTLTAVGKGISDLSGLEWAVNLKSADLRNNNIASTAPIDGLTQLTSLLLSGNPVLVAMKELDGDIPTLPEWGLILMAGLLILAASKRQRARRQPPLVV